MRRTRSPVVPAWRRVLLMGWNDLRRTLRDRQSFAWMLLMPIVMMWIFGQASSGSSGLPKISLAVDDRDGGWLARAIVEELHGDQVNLVELDAANPPETPPLRTLVLPAGLTESVLAGESLQLRLEIDPEADQNFGIGAQVHIQRSLVRVLGRIFAIDLSSKNLGEEAGTDGAENEPLATTPEARYRELAAEAPLVELLVNTAGKGTPVPQGFAQSVPGMLTMTVLMMTVIYGGIFLVGEKQEGMLRRQASLPITYGEIVLGKIVGRLFIAGMQIIVLFIVGRVIFGLSMGSSPLGLCLMMGSFAFAVAGLATMLGAVLRTPEQVSSLGWILSMILAGLGGCWWPAEVMPEWLRDASHVLPTAWAMDGFHALISYGRGVEAVWLPALVLFGFGALFSWIATRFLRIV